MAKCNDQRYYEEKRLTRILSEIQKQLEHKSEFLSKLKSTVLNERKALWDDGPRQVDSFDAAVNLSQQISELRHSELGLEHSRRQVRKLERMLFSPYFGRIDFQEKGNTQREEIYIGISSLIEQSGEPLIYDWRAPIASMFYDFELGTAHYLCQAGLITGDISLKRQYKIENSHLIYMFDSNLKIDDEILQEILSKQTDEKMRTIVSSIQREQNQVIRDDQHQVLFVQGAAGSGKTSIALHRAAYYLYKEREQITSKNILIFSPNRLFGDYISNVLPELGEETILSTTFQDFTSRLLPSNLKVEDFYDQLEFAFSTTSETKYHTRQQNIYYKSTPEFLKVIENYIHYLTTRGKPFNDLLFQGKVILSREQLQTLYQQSYAYLPMKKRLIQIQRRAFFLLRPLTRQRIKHHLQTFASDHNLFTEKELKARSRLATKTELIPVREEIHSWTDLDTFQLYKKLFSNEALFLKMAEGTLLPPTIDLIRTETLKNLEQGWLGYEDLASFLYFKGKIEGFPKFPEIKHLIVDEAQDYTFLQYKVINELFSTATLTVLGDLNQAIHPLQYQSSFEEIKDLFNRKKSGLFNLNKSYRSTKEITTFTSNLLKRGGEIEYINRPGTKPLVVKVQEENKIPLAIAEKIQFLKAEGMRSLAVIAKTSGQCQTIYLQLKELVNLRLITKDDLVLSTGVIIIPSYLAKGLEFDAVLIYGSDQQNYFWARELNIYYTACTRALHRLILFYHGQPSPFLTRVDPELYEHEDYL